MYLVYSILFFCLKLPENAANVEATVRRGASDFKTFASSGDSIKLIGPSQVYTLSCRQYRWPLLAPLALEEPGPTWMRPCSTAKIKERRELRDAGIARCMAITSLGVRLREQVVAVNVGAEATSTLLLDPFKPRLVAADHDGIVRVFDFYQYGTPPPSTLLNQFQVVPDVNNSYHPIRALYRLNDFYNEVLMTCTSDGAVSVWRNYAIRGKQQLATAWQSVLVPCAVRSI